MREHTWGLPMPTARNTSSEPRSRTLRAFVSALLVGGILTVACSKHGGKNGDESRGWRRIDLTEAEGAWYVAPRGDSPHLALERIVARQSVGTGETAPLEAGGDEAILVAHQIPAGSVLSGGVVCTKSAGCTVSFILLGERKGVVFPAWSATVDGNGESGTLTVSAAAPDTGRWIGGVFALRGPGARRGSMRVENLMASYEPTEPETPNIVLVTLDTFRADHLSCMSDSAPATPVLDSLANAGVLGENAVATSQCTNPSHVSIMTGLYCFSHNVLHNTQGVSSKAVTLAEVLKSNGYRTLGAVSARHLNPETSNLSQGFDTFVPSRWEQPGGEPADVRTSEVLRMLQRSFHDPKPIFVWIHYFDPHTPYSPPASFAASATSTRNLGRVRYVNGMGRVAYDERNGMVVDPGGELNRYRGEIAFLDHEIGRLLRGMEQLGLLDKGVMIVVGDHGEGLGEHGVYFQHAGLFEPVIRVPLILTGYGIPKGIRIVDRISCVDLFPTALELAGVPERPTTHGVNLLPLLEGKQIDRTEPIIAQAVSDKIRAAWSGSLKTIWVPKVQRKDWTMPERTLCFDLAADPLELNNIPPPGEEARRARERYELMAASPPVSLEPFDGHVETGRLRALGYVE